MVMIFKVSSRPVFLLMFFDTVNQVSLHDKLNEIQFLWVRSICSGSEDGYCI